MIGITAMKNILWIHLFDKLLSGVPHQEQGFYVCENQGWERAFLYAWRKYEHGKVVGIAHSTIRYWDLRYYDASMTTIISDLPRPDALAVNGPKNWFNLENAGHPMEHCIRVEALRYLHLNDISNNSKKKGGFLGGKRRMILLGDIQRDTTNRMLRLLESVNEKRKIPYEVLIKPHPHNQIDLVRYPNLKAINNDFSLKELLKIADFAFSSVFTSAELDAYCSGMPVIIYLDPFDLNLSNLRGIEGTKFVSTEEEFCEALEQIQFGELETGKPEDFFWLDPELPMWKSLCGSKNNTEGFNNLSNLNKVKSTFSSY